jgi:hypothetical protein
MCLGKVELLVMADSSNGQRSRRINDEELAAAFSSAQLIAASRS